MLIHYVYWAGLHTHMHTIPGDGMSKLGFTSVDCANSWLFIKLLLDTRMFNGPVLVHVRGVMLHCPCSLLAFSSRLHTGSYDPEIRVHTLDQNLQVLVILQHDYY